jgi:hypothetical protein
MHTMNDRAVFSADILKLDAAVAVDRIVRAIRRFVMQYCVGRELYWGSLAALTAVW